VPADVLAAEALKTSAIEGETLDPDTNFWGPDLDPFSLLSFLLFSIAVNPS
jgi:hypothetical protein